MSIAAASDAEIPAGVDRHGAPAAYVDYIIIGTGIKEYKETPGNLGPRW
ncbi:MAG TPA: hypothetical protein VFZ37_11980 [Jiangellaceae bacterium]